MDTGPTPRRVTKTLLLVCILCLVAASAPRRAVAAAHDWDGSADAQWSTNANWTPVGPIAAGDDLTFPAGSANLLSNNDLAANTSFNSLAFTGPVSGYSLSGAAIILVAGIDAANNGSNTIGFAIALSAAQTFQASGSRLILEGTIGLGANVLTFDTDTDGVFQVEADITGTGGVIVTGDGVVFLNDPVTYSGPTTLNGGDFSPDNMNPASVVTVNNGASIQLVNSASVGPVIVNPGGVLQSSGGLTLIGFVTDLTMTAGSDWSLTLQSVSNYGQINASGAVSLGGATLNFNPAFLTTTGDSFTILNKTSGGPIVGTFAGLPEGAVFVESGRTYRITYVGGDGNDVVVTDIGAEVVPVTEIPTLGGGALVVFGLLVALAGALFLRRSL